MCVICESFGKLSLQGQQGAGMTSGGASTATPKIFSPSELASRIAAVNWDTHEFADRWHTASAPKLQMTYSFENAQPSDLWGSFSGWTAFNASQKAAVQKALALFAEVINVSFTEVAASHSDPDINFRPGEPALCGSRRLQLCRFRQQQELGWLCGVRPAAWPDQPG